MNKRRRYKAKARRAWKKWWRENTCRPAWLVCNPDFMVRVKVR